MKKKNYTMRIAAGVMTAALLSTCAISSTFAKYTSKSPGTPTARVAKWDIWVGGETTMNKTFTFDLYSTLYDTTANNAETEVKTDDDVKRIAPGTQGSFAVKITNQSEVKAKYTVSFAIGYTVDTANTETVKIVTIPLQFSKDRSDWKTSIAALNIADTDAVELGMTDSDKSATYTVYWKWDYEDATDSSRDENDTILGTAGAEIQITATVTATQVD